MPRDPSRTLFGSNVDSDIQPLWEDGDRAFCRAWRRQIHGSRAVVLVVRPNAEHPATLDRLAHECGLREELDEAWAVRPLELIREAGRTMLVLEDPCGEPLLNLLGIRMEPKRFLRLAVGITRAVGKLHRHGLVHKDLKPAHILVNCPDEQVRLTGFGLASRLSRERVPPEPAEFIAGSLPYMAPEQTGRMNRSVDCRSDLYSLGVTFYQMLTGALPFTGSDPLQWIHCHIARKATPPVEKSQNLPEPISQIVINSSRKPPRNAIRRPLALSTICNTVWQHGPTTAASTHLSSAQTTHLIGCSSPRGSMAEPRDRDLAWLFRSRGEERRAEIGAGCRLLRHR
uniref:Hypothetical 38.2 kDa protein n=1 Tax=Bradyrhizobium sp. (strain WM9) TaxID=133505 RepID=Q9AQ02_BRASW|nr:hypothetical 38.2 kDa protein [Bradyrhizobium sp. WM9]